MNREATVNFREIISQFADAEFGHIWLTKFLSFFYFYGSVYWLIWSKHGTNLFVG